MKRTTKKLINHFNRQKERINKEVEGLVLTIYGIAKHIGMSHQYVHSRLKDHNWSNTDVLALGELFKTEGLGGKELTLQVRIFLKENKKKKKKLWTRADAAKYLGISTSLLYQRMKKHNWKDSEKLKIDNL